MGVLDPAPRVGEWDKVVPALTPTAKPAETPAAKPGAPAKTTPAPTAPAAPVAPGGGIELPKSGGGSGVQGAMQDIAALEHYRNSVAPPKMTLPPKPETKSITDSIQAWGAIAVAFAAFASMRTRTPMMSAMNAAAAALNGMHEGQQEAVEQAYKQWDRDTKIAMQMADYEQRAFEDLMNQITTREELRLKGAQLEDTATGRQQDFAMKIADFKLRENEIKNTEAWRKSDLEMRTYTAASNDPQMYDAWKNGGVAGASQLAKAREDFTRDMEQKKFDLEKEKVEHDAKRLLGEAIQNMTQAPDWPTLSSEERVRRISEAMRGSTAAGGKPNYDAARKVITDSEGFKKAQAAGDSRTVAKLLAMSGDPKDMKEWEDLEAKYALETGRDTRQDKGIAAAGERQDKGIAAAGERQDKGIAATGERQDRALTAADTRQTERLVAEMERLNVSFEDRVKIQALNGNLQEKLLGLRNDEREKILALQSDEREKIMHFNAAEREKLLGMTWAKRKEYLDETTAARKMLFGEKMAEDEKLAAMRLGGVQRNLNELEQTEKFKAADPLEQIEMRAAVLAKSSPAVWTRMKHADVDPVAAEKVADQIGTYRHKGLSGYVLSTDFGQQVSGIVAEKYPGYSEQDYDVIHKAKQNLLGKDGDNIAAMDKIAHHLKTYKDLLQKVKDAGITDLNVPAANRLASWFSTEAGLPEVTNLKVAGRILAKEIGKFLAGMGQTDAASRAEDQAELEIKGTDQMNGVLTVLNPLMLGQLDGILSKYHTLFEHGWMKPTEVVPERTLQTFLPGVDHDAKYGVGTKDDAYSGLQDISKINDAIDSATTSAERQGAKEKAPPGMTHTRPLKSGGQAYGPSENGPWYDEEGNPLGR